jgi:predicted Na+-dependent transporter
MIRHVFIQNLLLMLLLPASVPLFMKPLIDPFPEALLKDLIFSLGLPSFCGTIF